MRRTGESAIIAPMALVSLLALPLIAALALFVLPERARRTAAAIAGVATLLAGVALVPVGMEVFAGRVVSVSWPWLDLPGAGFGLRADGLAFLFALLVIGIGALVILYARYYLAPTDPMARFYAQFMLFMAAMLGIVLADNLLLLVIFWELTSLSSFLLIAYWPHRADARQAARMAVVVTGSGGLALLAGVLLLAHITGSFSLDVVLASGDLIRGHPLYLPALALILLGAFTKSAQFPFHFWLPQAMAAPTPVSAYLHSATMVKAGVFLIARLYPALSGTDAWLYVVGAVGLATLLVGAYLAIFQHDLKGLLAYSTISHLGLITFLFGLGSPLATVAGVFHILNHATFKASLFMAAGIIDHETGTRDMRRLGGLWRYMPQTAVLAIISSLAMAGVPLLNGFLSKEMFYGETLQVAGSRPLAVVIPVIAMVATAFAVAYSVRFIHDVFFSGDPRNMPRVPHEPPQWMRVPVGVLAVICLLVGILPGQTIGPLLAVGARSALGGTLPQYSLAVWHGLTLPLVMSLLALVLGTAFYFSLKRLFALHDIVHLPHGGAEIFAWIIQRLQRASRWLVTAMEGCGARGTLLALVLATLAAILIPWLADGRTLRLSPAGENDLMTLVIWVVGMIAIVGVVALHRRRLAALIFVGVAGLVVSLTFVFFSAPDLALTQLLVEVVSVVLLMLALYYLPGEGPREDSAGRRLTDGAIALLAGVCMTALAYLLLTGQSETISEYFLAKSLPEGGGTNVVNVILVDFRGFDTLGEITVLGIAGLTVFALLRDFRPAPGPQTAGTPAGRSLLMATAGRILLPFAVVVSLFLFLRGHNLPGGGFIAGLVLSVAMLVAYIGSGARWTEERLRIDWHTPIGAGLAIAALTGVGSFLFSHPFLTSSHAEWHIPLLGKVPFATAMFFDLGVYATVTGATMLSLSMLGKLSPRTGSP